MFCYIIKYVLLSVIMPVYNVNRSSGRHKPTDKNDRDIDDKTRAVKRTFGSVTDAY